MKEESKLQTKIIKYLKSKGWLVNKISLCSVTGWPDIYAIKNRMSPIHIEAKAKGKKPTPLQEYVHAQISEHGGVVWVIDNFEEFKRKLFLHSTY